MSWNQCNRQTARNKLGWLASTLVLLYLAPGCASHAWEIRQYGRMHEVLSGGAAAAQPCVPLADVLRQPHAYGVGALAGLRGEVTICDGEVWIAQPDGDSLHVDGPTTVSREAAALLTAAHVAHWIDIHINQPLGGEELENFIAEHASQTGLDTRQPFPLVIDGPVTDLQAHVINGDCPMRPGVLLAADQHPWRYQLEVPQNAKIVAFYAADSVGNLTHPGTSLHAHALFDVGGKTVTAHVERVGVAAGAVLRLPANRKPA